MNLPRFSFDSVHTGMDVLLDAEEFDPVALRALVDAHGKPVRTKEKQGTPRHAALMAAGGRVYQTCPPQNVDATTPAVKQWAKKNDKLATVSGERFDVLEAYARLYEVNHAEWNPVGDGEALRAALKPMIETELDVQRSRFVSYDGEIIAAAFVFPAGDIDEVGVEALLPEHELARDAVGSCMGRVLTMAAGEVSFDGHASDPHFAPLLRTLPGVFADEARPLDLIRIDPAA